MHAFRFGLVGLLISAIVGCGGGEKGVTVEGTVLKNGTPITLGDSEGVTITISDGASTFSANASENGTFSVQKPAGGPIPAGKYKVKYVHYQNPSPYSKKQPFRVEKEVPGEWDVRGSSQKFTIELGSK